MLLLASAVRGRRHRQLYTLLTQCPSRDRLFGAAVRRYAHIQPQNTEPKPDDIRNIGIIAHVDAGKTTTTERMLYYSGRTNHIGNVDHGDTITDFLPMERERGITIQSAAITFKWPVPANPNDPEDPANRVHSRTINLIDTPGHQDFRFEVDRCLPILDGAICIIDGVKGVEAHTERVWEAAHDFKIPRLLYVNKMDRDGASFRKSIMDVASKLKGQPLVCQIPWWSKEKFVGVIDIIDCIGYRWHADSPRAIASPREELTEMLESKPKILEEIQTARAKLVDQLCVHDDTLMEIFLATVEAGKTVDSADIKTAIRRIVSTGNGSCIPIFVGASAKNMGVEPLLDAVVDYLPSPQERPEVEVHIGNETYSLEKALELDVESHNKPHKKVADHPRIGAIATVFKVVNDPFRGLVCFARVYHGEVSRRAALWNSSIHSFEKPLSLMQISADKRVEIQHLRPGQIGALIGLKSARTGDTLLTFPQHKSPPVPIKNLAIRPANVPPAVAFVSIDPNSPSEAKAIEAALEGASREDPSLRWNRDEKTDQFILSGMGKLHLEIAKHNLKTNYKLKAQWGGIEVDYKECLLGPSKPHYSLFDRVVAGKEGKASCEVTVAPLEKKHMDKLSHSCFKREGNVIHIHIPRGTGTMPFDPEEVRPQLLNGALAALSRGPRRGAPVHEAHVTIVYDKNRDYFGPTTGSHLFSAAFRAVNAALREAHSNSLVGMMEPVMKVNITCPEDVSGNVQHDIASGAGGQVLQVSDRENYGEGSEAAGSPVLMRDVYAPPDPYDTVRSLKDDPSASGSRMLEILAKVPLKSMLDYDNHLRGRTKGRHTILMSLDTFQRVTGSREKALDDAL